MKALAIRIPWTSAHKLTCVFGMAAVTWALAIKSVDLLTHLFGWR